MANLNALSFAKSRPNTLKGPRDVDNYFTLLERILRQIQDQVGTASGEIDFGPIVEQSVISAVQIALLNNVNDISVSSNHITAGNEFVIATSELTVTLNPEPYDNERVTIQHFGSPSDNVTVSGNINGETEIIMINPGDCMDLEYSILAGRWSIV